MAYGTTDSEHGNSSGLQNSGTSFARWSTAAAVALSSFLNATLCMTFSTMEEFAKAVLDQDGPGVAALYTVWLVVTVLGLGPALYFVERYERATLYFCTLCTVLSAWQRWYGIAHGTSRYFAGVLSEILCGIGAWSIFTLPGKISHKRFPKHEQTLATSFMLQANYFGWLLSTALQPIIVHDEDSFMSMLLVQGCIAAVCGVAVVLMYQPLTSEATALVAATPDSVEALTSSGFSQVFQSIYSTPFFGVQLVAYGLLGGIGFSTPSAIFFILGDRTQLAAAANSAFIGFGVLTGLLLGYYCKNPTTFGISLKSCHVGCAVSLLLCSLQVHFDMLDSGAASAIVLLLLTACAGASSLGFIGIAIESLACSYPVKAAYICWAVESFILVSASVFSDRAASASGLWLMTVAAGICMLPIVCFYQPPEKSVDA
eukprot:TRINITY_DN17353_c0_g1_i1.p1 TRINITY_DN17353_c0_g1~~TRINITY_DN17353_c0_g1_i1.p1  ORF type:complete len:429 (+),score=55.47 TRINITY_DN17353_c0_g1_i1:92-1378(+)